MVYVYSIFPPTGEKFAENMRYNRKFVRPLVDSVVHLEQLRLLPNLTEICRYYMYTRTRDWRQTGSSVVVRTASCHFFTLEVSCNYEYDGKPRLFLRVESYCGRTEDLVFRGRVWNTGFNIIYGALNMLDRLCFFFKYRNNAKRFAEKFLTTLGIGYHTCLQDYERVLLYSFGLSVAEIFKDLFDRTARPVKPSVDFYMVKQVRHKEQAFF